MGGFGCGSGAKGPCKATMCSSQPLVSPSGEAAFNHADEYVGIFDIFKVGIGPSSSHTVGPMAAAARFIKELRQENVFAETSFVRCDLLGSLALTGMGHGTDKAVIVGLSGEEPALVDPDEADRIFERVKADGTLRLAKLREIVFLYDDHMVFHYDAEMPQHPNGMKLTAYDSLGDVLYYNEYLSIGGGFVKTVAEYDGVFCSSPASTAASTPYSKKLSNMLDDFDDLDDGLQSQKSFPSQESLPSVKVATIPTNTPKVPYPFKYAVELLDLCNEHNLSIGNLMMENEAVHSCGGDMMEVHRRLDKIWNVMSDCIERGKQQTGVLPVSGMRRQANGIYERLTQNVHQSLTDHFAVMDWITLFARCVNEENAGGGRIVTSPTNGAAGTLPAVLAYYVHFIPGSSPAGIRTFIATAAAFGALLKTNASISGAEAGCQAEIGSACAMAAAGLCCVQGGTLEQIENAAEIGLEHNLGMTCDPLMGLVQVPCIERNCVASVKAVTACRLALKGDGRHEVSFDSCVETMYRTGLDMQSKYRETSTGGLALYARRPQHYQKAEKLRAATSRKNLNSLPSNKSLHNVLTAQQQGLGMMKPGSEALGLSSLPLSGAA
eukprot:Lankesteria_metandrocarpae@DN4128_c1_g1_i1.p1